MKYAFAQLASNYATRKFGGTTVGVADPYVTGYHYIWFESLPAGIVEYAKGGNSSISNISDIQKVLSATCLSVTPPGGTLNTVEFTGLGGIKWAVPGNIDYGNEVSIKFFEFNKTPLLDIMHGWVKMIRDYRVGVSNLEDKDDGSGYTKKTYASLLYYWTTAPDGYTVEYHACYDGVFPKKDPQDLFGSDVETVGRLDVEIPFNVDYIWHEDWTLRKCQTLSKNFADVLQSVKKYGQTESGGA
jgi:hypothetical protein